MGIEKFQKSNLQEPQELKEGGLAENRRKATSEAADVARGIRSGRYNKVKLDKGSERLHVSNKEAVPNFISVEDLKQQISEKVKAAAEDLVAAAEKQRGTYKVTSNQREPKIIEIIKELNLSEEAGAKLKKYLRYSLMVSELNIPKKGVITKDDEATLDIAQRTVNVLQKKGILKEVAKTKINPLETEAA